MNIDPTFGRELPGDGFRPSLSIVIPAYNEESRLPQTLEKIAAYLNARQLKAELLVVDDGSRDRTCMVASSFPLAQRAPASRLYLLHNPGNRGKGYSVRHGMLQARGTLLLFSDADLSSPIEELTKLEAALAAGADIAIGSRSKAELIQAHQSAFREWGGRMFNRVVTGLLGLSFKDTQCGFKLFRREAALQVFPYQRIERWGFDPELLFIARLRRLQVAEVPVVWAHAEGAKIHALSDGIRSVLEVASIRWNHLRGRYSLRPMAVPETEPQFLR